MLWTAIRSRSVELARPRFDPDMVLDYAVSTFWQNGYDATGVEALCDITKLGPGSLYAAFGGRVTFSWRRWIDIGIRSPRTPFGAFPVRRPG